MATSTAGDQFRPPSERNAASSPAVGVRPSVRQRPLLPTRLERVESGYSPGDPYVRRFWVAAIGRGAVSELLRLIRAAGDARPMPLPIWLPTLLRTDLVRIEEGVMIVADKVPAVPVTMQRRFSPGLREEHRRLTHRKRP